MTWNFLLGFKFAYSASSMNIFQCEYALDILFDAGMLGSRPISTLIDYCTHLHHDSGIPLSDPSSYRRMINRLIYLTNTRPNITYVVQHLSQFVQHAPDCFFSFIFISP